MIDGIVLNVQLIEAEKRAEVLGPHHGRESGMLADRRFAFDGSRSI